MKRKKLKFEAKHNISKIKSLLPLVLTISNLTGCTAQSVKDEYKLNENTPAQEIMQKPAQKQEPESAPAAEASSPLKSPEAEVTAPKPTADYSSVPPTPTPESEATAPKPTAESSAASSTPSHEATSAQFTNEQRDTPYTEGATVSIVRSSAANAEDITESEISQMVHDVLFRTDDFRKLFKNGQTVVIKPNLVQMIVDSTGELLDKTVNGITTDWRVANAVVNEVRLLNPDGKIFIMEGSATGRTKDVMAYYNYTPEYMPEVDGFFAFEEDCGAWQDFDAPQLIKAHLPYGLLHKEYWFSRILYEADVLISIPSLKTASGVVVTGGIKNISLGTPPGNIYGVSEDNAGKTSMVSHNMHGV
ncbi:MAG: DUF362 domain-containing protein [Clostridiales bacterium]|jgi:hypothetical protein|nr:DUF362 domain-containing protein [Clostridiales bacterium]